ncbi:sortase domain-bontaining protein [Pediococcus pentosaceus]|uniref:sortase domain-containing protein n=1 Tax=Pediococcus pentosaceus TaxID=1255 RepID=UPI001F3640DF|nr:sortase [Pediococcus pentosaceus]
MNNQPIYLANNDGIYEYYIKQQKIVKADDVGVLNPKQKAQVTIITCLFLSTSYRTITIGKLERSYTWRKSPTYRLEVAKIVGEFGIADIKIHYKKDQ